MYDLTTKDTILLIRDRIEMIEERYSRNIGWVPSTKFSDDMRRALAALDDAQKSLTGQ